MLTTSLLLLGIGALYGGAEILVRGASSFSRRMGISPMVVGLTVVAFATSLPELLVSLMAALEGRSDIAIANVMGSNLINVGVVLGIAALFVPLATNRTFLRQELAVMIGASLLVTLMLTGGGLSRLDGVVLLLAMASFLVWLLRRALRTGRDVVLLVDRVREPEVELGRELQGCDAGACDGECVSGGVRQGFASGGPLADLLRVAVGLLILMVGARALISSAVSIAQWMGVSERLIGITIVALGTSLPELAATLVAAVKRIPDIALGNVVGSNIFNLLMILGVSATVSPISIDFALIRQDLVFMLLVSFMLVPMARTGWKISRQEGVVLLVAYAVFLFGTIATDLF